MSQDLNEGAQGDRFPLLFSKKQSAQALNVCLRTVDTLIAEKALKVRKIRGRVLIAREELLRFAKGR